KLDGDPARLSALVRRVSDRQMEIARILPKVFRVPHAHHRWVDLGGSDIVDRVVTSCPAYRRNGNRSRFELISGFVLELHVRGRAHAADGSPHARAIAIVPKTLAVLTEALVEPLRPLRDVIAPSKLILASFVGGGLARMTCSDNRHHQPSLVVRVRVPDIHVEA